MGTKEIQSKVSDACNLVLYYLLTPQPYQTLHVFYKSTTWFTNNSLQF